MLQPEASYAFKQELNQIHKKDRRNPALTPAPEEFVFQNGITIVLPDFENEVIVTAAEDFCDYLRTSMQVFPVLADCAEAGTQTLRVSLCQALEDASGYMGHRITVLDDGILLEGYDARGVAQGFYYLEDLMNLRAAPFLKKGTSRRKAVFSPRITQSPFGPFQYSDECLSLLAHLGFDAIDLWIYGPDQTRTGYLDFNQLCARAKKYGIDVYAELYIRHSMHPEDPGAQEFYDKLYGDLFKHCPGIKGITFVGEATHFKSRDPHVTQENHSNDITANIPSEKIASGWWPCCDYPDLMVMIQRSIRKYRPDAQILFCTYNWGHQPEADRIRLIEALPEGIDLLVTWDMFHTYKVGQAQEGIADYSLCFIGPGEYFTSEAIAAKKRGMRLLSIANTSGRTWDFGVIPYEPMPYQWIKRYRAILKAHEDWDLSGMIENIHYAFHPSFITELEKWAYFTNCPPLEDVLKALLIRDFGEENLAAVDKAMHLWSEAITHYIATDEDQYGPFRIGPSYPFWTIERNPVKIPAPPHAFHGSSIYSAMYDLRWHHYSSLPGVRIFEELPENAILRDMLLEGVNVLKAVPNPNDRLLKLINLGEFMYRTTVTAIHLKNFHILLTELKIARTKENAARILDEMEQILLQEKENVLATVPLVRVDSRLGWEPSMDYTTNEDCLRWKLKQLELELEHQIPHLRRSNAL